MKDIRSKKVKRIVSKNKNNTILFIKHSRMRPKTIKAIKSILKKPSLKMVRQIKSKDIKSTSQHTSRIPYRPKKYLKRHNKNNRFKIRTKKVRFGFGD